MRCNRQICDGSRSWVTPFERLSSRLREPMIRSFLRRSARVSSVLLRGWYSPVLNDKIPVCSSDRVPMNDIARQKLISELDHLILNKPAMGTLLITMAQTTDMLVVTLEKGAFSLAYPHTGRFDFVRPRRFARFCRERGKTVTKRRWGDVRVSCAVIGTAAADAAQTIAECFSNVYGASGPFGLGLQGMGWQSST
jgi:hypothetical protein